VHFGEVADKGEERDPKGSGERRACGGCWIVSVAIRAQSPGGAGAYIHGCP